ncbi:MAG TPA: DUF6498-containing protein [Rhodanobacteraceae bacterium]|nr:DUF6498-containing protein [Rhodanobacteraceae bacterium]
MDTATPNAPAVTAPSGARLRGVALALLINAVPLVGVLRYEWSAINVLVLYWFENLLIAVCTCIRIAVHRRLTRKKGYWRTNQLGIEVNDKPMQTGLLGEYAVGAFVFTGAHGVFVGAITLILHQNFPDQALWQISFDQVVRGAGIIAAMLGIELAVDLSHIRYRSYAWMRAYVDGRMGRIIVLHLTIIFGMFGMAMTESPMWILYILIGLKTLTDVGSAAGRGTPASSEPVPPPAWTLRLADRIGKDKGGAKAFMKKYEADLEKARRNAIEDEEVMPEGKP